MRQAEMRLRELLCSPAGALSAVREDDPRAKALAECRQVLMARVNPTANGEKTRNHLSTADRVPFQALMRAQDAYLGVAPSAGRSARFEEVFRDARPRACTPCMYAHVHPHVYGTWLACIQVFRSVHASQCTEHDGPLKAHVGAYELLCGSLLRLLGQPIEKFNKYKRDAHVRLHALIGPTGPYGQLPADDPRAPVLGKVYELLERRRKAGLQPGAGRNHLSTEQKAVIEGAIELFTVGGASADLDKGSLISLPGGAVAGKKRAAPKFNEPYLGKKPKPDAAPKAGAPAKAGGASKAGGSSSKAGGGEAAAAAAAKLARKAAKLKAKLIAKKQEVSAARAALKAAGPKEVSKGKAKAA